MDQLRFRLIHCNINQQAIRLLLQSNIPPTAPLDSSGYEPIEPASPMTLESAGPPRMPLAAASTPPPGSGTCKVTSLRSIQYTVRCI